MLSLRAFAEKTADCVVYWGTSGQRITDTYQFDSFCMAELKEKLCPDEFVLQRSVEIRKHPMNFLNDSSVFDYAETLAEIVQRYADVLEAQLSAADN